MLWQLIAGSSKLYITLQNMFRTCSMLIMGRRHNYLRTCKPQDGFSEFIFLSILIRVKCLKKYCMNLNEISCKSIKAPLRIFKIRKTSHEKICHLRYCKILKVKLTENVEVQLHAFRFSVLVLHEDRWSHGRSHCTYSRRNNLPLPTD